MKRNYRASIMEAISFHCNHKDTFCFLTSPLPLLYNTIFVGRYISPNWLLPTSQAQIPIIDIGLTVINSIGGV